MAEKLDPRQVVTFEELLRAMMLETAAHGKPSRTLPRIIPEGGDLALLTD